MFVTVVEHFECPGVLIPIMKGDAQPDNVLGFLEGVRDAAPVVLSIAVEDVSLARPARALPEIVVPCIGRYAAARAAAIAGSPRVVAIGVHVDPGPVASVDECWDESGLRGAGFIRRVRKLESLCCVDNTILFCTILT